ncbi:MAG: hypothetical protein LCH61_04140 [Proteobacteria bacterium]|nr:hypothetical protein [Pseudomonadota bacterium]
MSWIANLLQGVLGSVAGGSPQQPAAPNSSMVPPAPPDPVSPAPPPAGLAGSARANGQDFLGDVIDDMGKVARQGMFAGVSGKIAGMAQKSFNDAAFPGTTPWEQLGGGGNAQGGGAFTDVALKSEELAQRDRESQRASHTALASARLQAGSALANTAFQNGDYATAERVLKAAGVFPQEYGMKAEMMANGRLAQEMRESDSRINLNWSQEKTSNTQADLNLSSADRNRMETTLAPFRFALDEWVSKYGKGQIAQELGGAAGIIKSVQSWISENPAYSQGELTDRLAKYLVDAGVPEGDVFMLLKMIR